MGSGRGAAQTRLVELHHTAADGGFAGQPSEGREATAPVAAEAVPPERGHDHFGVVLGQDFLRLDLGPDARRGDSSSQTPVRSRQRLK